ncbi:MAG TPA: site-specific integrase [Acidobacterium sp.]|nr:site-specific integrase [Acidobacterium sp.]
MRGIFNSIIRAACKRRKRQMSTKQRQTFQRGWIVRKARSKGSDVWVLRWRDGDTNRSTTLGTTQQLRSRAEAQRAASKLTAEINNSIEVATFGQLVARYLQEAIPERESTAAPLRAMLNARLLPRWENVRISDMAKDPMMVEQWIKGLQSKPRRKGEKPRDLSPKSKLHTRSVLHRLFEYAMRWRYLDCQRNPMSLIELRGTTRRVRPIYLLTPQQYYQILANLAPHVRLMAVLAMNTGLRISEILGMRWTDANFEERTLTISRSIVGRHEGETKTMASADVLPLHEMLVQELRAWQAREDGVNGWLFGNLDTGRPYHASSLRNDHLAPAGRKAGIPNLGWHNFRHTYRARLGDSGAEPEVQQRLMRHSSIDMTMKYGQNAMLKLTRPANAKLVEELLAFGADAPQLRPQNS